MKAGERQRCMITRLLQFMLEGPQPCTILCFTLTFPAKSFKGIFFFWSVALTCFQTYCGLCRVKAKNDNKNI